MTDSQTWWDKVRACEGQTFRKVEGGEFTYRVKGNSVSLNSTNQMIARSQFEKALGRMPVSGPGALNDLRAPSCVFAILTDPRIGAG